MASTRILPLSPRSTRLRSHRRRVSRASIVSSPEPGRTPPPPYSTHPPLTEANLEVHQAQETQRDQRVLVRQLRHASAHREQDQQPQGLGQRQQQGYVSGERAQALLQSHQLQRPVTSVQAQVLQPQQIQQSQQQNVSSEQADILQQSHQHQQHEQEQPQRSAITVLETTYLPSPQLLQCPWLYPAGINSAPFYLSSTAREFQLQPCNSATTMLTPVISGYVPLPFIGIVVVEGQYVVIARLDGGGMQPEVVSQRIECIMA